MAKKKAATQYVEPEDESRDYEEPEELAEEEEVVARTQGS